MAKATKKSAKKNLGNVDPEGALGKGWPPAWSVSFSDITTLLMTAFVLLYSLTTAKIPAEFLVMTKAKTITSKELQQLEEIKQQKAIKTGKRLVKTIKKVAPNNTKAMVSHIKNSVKFEKEVKSYINNTNLKDSVEIKIIADEVVLSPKSALLFYEGEAKLRPESIPLLDKVANILLKQGNYDIRIEGHTDPRPINPLRHKYRSNFELSFARALSIAEYFISKGIAPEKIGVMGYGSEKPKVPNTSKENMAQNRRVEIMISFIRQQEETIEEEDTEEIPE